LERVALGTNANPASVHAIGAAAPPRLLAGAEVIERVRRFWLLIHSFDRIDPEKTSVMTRILAGCVVCFARSNAVRYYWFILVSHIVILSQSFGSWRLRPDLAPGR
jgi:hypothetical protein